MTSPWFPSALAGAALAMLLSPSAAADEPALEPAPAGPVAVEPPVEPPPTWRFRHDDKPVKVVVLAGSIGAWPRQPYAEQLERICTRVEVRNISKTGLGALALKQRFDQQVIDNPHLRWNDEGQEHWLVFGGGLNSVGSPRSTNHHMRRLFEVAHRRGLQVVALTLTPWGDDRDKRWRGVEGLKSKHTTQAVVDFTMGRLTPEQALGALASKRRVAADAPWDPSEIPDIAIDLYDSPLRDRDAALRDHDEMYALLAKSKEWQRAHNELDALQRENKLEADVQVVEEIPRWYMRTELRSFDHIHPNEQGHRLMAAVMCPSLPESWGCACPEVEPKPELADETVVEPASAEPSAAPSDATPADTAPVDAAPVDKTAVDPAPSDPVP